MIHRDEDGNLPSFAWPGGYPLYYLCADGGILCPGCANGRNGSEASEDSATPADWRLEAQHVHWEGEPLACDHCGAGIESAYGNPDAPEELDICEDDEEPQEPEDGDYVISDTGALGALTAVSVHGGKHLQTFQEESEARAFIRERMAREGFSPNVWRLSDHGNWILSSASE